MPYLPSEAAKKSKLYNNIINGAEIEYQNEIEFLKQQQQISASLDSNTPLRDEDGFLVSFESEEVGVALEEQFEEVRLENAQYFFEGEIDNEFTHYFQPEEDPDEDDEEQDNSDEDVTDEEVDFQMTKRDNLIQVINVYFEEENTPDMSTSKLHSKLNEFFRVEGQRPKAATSTYDRAKQAMQKLRGKKQFKNAEGWEDFRQDKLNVERFTRKGKKKRLFGGRGHRHNYRSLKDDLNTFRYDDVINKQLYHTKRGQEIWLELGFRYQRDEK